jgi:hypothetical protein
MIRKGCFVFVALATLAAVPARAAEPGQTIISSDYGSLTVAAILQGLIQARFDGSNIDRQTSGPHFGTIDDYDDVYANNHFDFSLQRARIILKGSLLSPNLTYVFQGDATLAEFVLDARVGYVIPEGEGISTTFSIGRFLPPFSLILPRLVSRLDAINYPLYLFTPWTAGSAFQPFASTNTTGRQVGLLVTQKLTSYFQLDMGVFNGFQRVVQTGGWADENDLKDFFVRASTKPIDGLMFAVDYWLGLPASLDRAVVDDPTTPANETHAASPFALSATDPTLQNDTDHFFLFEAEFTMVEGLKLMGEFAYTHQTIRTADASLANPAETTVDGVGGWFHAGYAFKDLLGAGADFELIARFDYFDPNIDVGDNTMMRFTFGPHFLLEGLHSQLRLNYMFNAMQTTLTPSTDFDDQRHEIWLQAVVEI